MATKNVTDRSFRSDSFARAVKAWSAQYKNYKRPLEVSKEIKYKDGSSEYEYPKTKDLQYIPKNSRRKKRYRAKTA